MGLFSFVGKALKGVGKLAAPVLRAAANKATGGLSESILKKLKGNPAKMSGPQVEVLLEKNRPPRTISTERGNEGWGYGKQPSAKVRRAVKRKPAQSRPERPRMPPKARTARRATPAKAPAAKKRRKAPASFAKFAQRSKELAAEWRAAGGKEGTGQSFFDWKRGR